MALLEGRAVARAQVPSDVTAAVLFLLSPGSGFVTGQVVVFGGNVALAGRVGQEAGHLVPRRVLAYAREKGLYRG